MKKVPPTRKPESVVLFVFLLGSKADFWVFASDQYHRFLFLGEDCRWIRSQPFLPPESTGYCIRISPANRQSLEREGRARGLILNFFTDEQECLANACQVSYAGFVAGASIPAGCLNAEGIVELAPLRSENPSVQTQGTISERGKNLPSSLRNLLKFRHP